MPASQSLDPAINEELNAIWTQVNLCVLELARGDESQIQKLDVKGVLKQLDRAQNAGAGQSRKSELVRTTFNRTLMVIQTVGGVAAGAASMVFGPTDLCFNALSFVITAWQGYQAVFEELATLLEQCTEYLQRLEYHMRAGMDANLSRVSAQHLLLFVEICSRTIRLRKKRTKLLAFTKIFFMQEDMVADLLDQMQRLVDKENRLVGAQTLALAAEAAEASQATLAVTQGLVNTLTGEKDTAAMNRLLLRVLAFDAHKMNENMLEPEASWATIYRNYIRRRVKGTGEWIFEEQQYQSWADGVGKLPILAIEGGEGSGKSYLASTIISRLKQQRTVESNGRRVSTAFYFVEGDSREELKKATNLEMVAKSLVWQFAQEERRYSKSAAGICERMGEVDPRDISKHLLFGNKDLSRMDVRFYIIIDGLGDAVGEGMIRFLQRACTPMPGRDVRVLLTGDSQCFDQLAQEEWIAIDRLSIEDRNGSDVRRYIDRRMNDMPALKEGVRRKGVSAIRDRIRQRLAEQARSDYFKIDTTLDTIEQCEYVTDIEQALEMAGRERSQQINQEIDDLNEQLADNELAEVNEMIRWTVHGAERLTPSQMGAALDLRAGEPSLLPLESKLQSKYRLFEVDRNGRISFRSSDIESLIPERQRDQGQQDPELSLDSEDATPAESAMVQHFLRTVCPRDVYDKFQFDSFLEKKRRRRRTDAIFRDDLHTGQARMALICLRILTSFADPQRDSLLQYALYYLVKHLGAVDLALADVSCKAAMGPLLVKLFTDDEALDILLQNDEFASGPRVRWRVRVNWFQSDEQVQHVVRWLSDSAVTAGIKDEAVRSWLKDVTSGKDSLLRPAAERMARCFLQEPHFKPLTRDAFLFLLTYVNKARGKNEVPELTYTPSLDEIDQVETWCQGVLGGEVRDGSSLWHVQVGTLLRYFKYKSQAEARARHALSLDPQDFRACTLLAEVVKPDEGIPLLESASKRLESDTEWTEDAFHRMELAKLLNTLGLLYWLDKQHDLTVSVCHRALTFDFTDYYRVLEVMKLYAGEQRWADILDTLETIKEYSTDENNLAEMVGELAEQPRFHHILLKLALETENVELLDEMYGASISYLDGEEKYNKLCHVRYFYGAALYGVPGRRNDAIKQWEQAMQQDLPRANKYRLLLLLISKLGPIYVDRARRADDPSISLQQLSSLLPDGISATAAIVGPEIYLARYWYTQGKIELAKQLTREIVQQALDLLRDDDLENDSFAIIRLLSVFVPLGDDKNAVACVRAMVAIGGKVSCDGDCGRSWDYGKGMWWCRDCININFDANCYQKLCRGEFKFNVCHRGHEFFYVGGLQKEDGVGIGEELITAIQKEYL